MEKLICPFCKDELKLTQCQMGGLHMSCAEAEIDVWSVALSDDPKNCFIEKDYEVVKKFLLEQEKEAENYSYSVEKKKILAYQFYNLPDFEGF